MVDQYLMGGKYFGYEDSYNHYEIDFDKILYKKVMANILLDTMICMI